jgi:type I restriction enzyme M protein
MQGFEGGIARPMASKGKVKSKAITAANLGFEQKLWPTAAALRNNMDAAEYKHVVLGLMLAKDISPC